MPPVPRIVRLLAIGLGALAIIPLIAVGTAHVLGHPLPPRAGAIGLFAALLAAAFTWFWIRGDGASARAACILLVATSAFAISLTPEGLRGGYLVWLYPAALIGFAFRPLRAALTTAALGALILFAAVFQAPPEAFWVLRSLVGIGVPALVTLGLSSWASITVAQLLWNNADLHAARDELARLAVEEERARFARDLHDLLGHTLSLVVVKLELASRLLPSQDHPAAAELREVEELARNALKDVREVAGGYRQPTLAAELAGAKVALDAAGIALRVTKDVGLLPPEVEATCAWTVREGVTNVVRHSGARACDIRIRGQQERVVVDVIDDGRGPDSSKPGMGLNGLRERVRQRGGSLAWKAASPAGFHLTALLPVDGRS